MERIIETLPNRKAPGIDGIRNEVLKLCPEIVGHMATCLIVRASKEGGFPDELKRAKTVLLPKGEPQKEPQFYRPIALLNTLYKIIDRYA